MLMALATVMCMATALSLIKTEVANAAESEFTVEVKYNSSDENLTVKQAPKDGGDKTNYYFYTTDKATTKVPAPNKWLRVPTDGVDCENVTGAKTFYFAMSTTPSLEDIVAVSIPAKQKLTKVTYDPVKKELKAYSGSTDVTSLVDYYPNGTGIQDMQDTNGGIVEVCIPALKAANTPVSSDSNNDHIFELEQTDGEGAYHFKDGFARSSNFKTVKIAKKAAAPAIKVDYVNHCFKFAKTVEAAEISAINEKSNYSSKATPVEIGNNKYIFFDDAAKMYSFRTAATEKKIESLDTVIGVDATSEFTANASIIGGYKEDAYLEIYPNTSETVANGASIAYQYVVLSDADYKAVVKGSGTDETFDYKTAMDKKIKWKTVKYSVSKSGTATNAKVKIANSGKKELAANSVVLVREAARTGKASSKVMIFTMPTESTKCWSSRKIGTTAITNNISIADVSIAEAEATFKMVIKNGKGKLVEDAKLKDFITVNKVAPSSVKLSIIKSGSNDTDDVELTIVVPDTLKLNSKDMTVATKAGLIKDSTYTYSKKFVKADTLAPTITTASTVVPTWEVIEDGAKAKVSYKIELSEDLAKAKTDGSGYEALSDGTVADIFVIDSSNANYSNLKVTYAKKSGRTKAYLLFEMDYDLTTAASSDGKVKYKDNNTKLYDLAGHPLIISDGIVIKGDSTIPRKTT